MRISDDTHFPHPVLSPYATDFLEGAFTLDLTTTEVVATGELSIEHQASVTEPAIRSLIESGDARVGCYIECRDTYFTELRQLSWPRGRSDFRPGTLLNRVTLRPLVWLTTDLPEWNPASIHPEFEPPVSLSRGDIIALAHEQIITIGQAKLAPLESIFSLEKAADVGDRMITVNLDADKITIRVGERLYETIAALRGQRDGHAVLMNSVYLPAVIETLDNLRDGGEQYEEMRWHRPFVAMCDVQHVQLDNDLKLLESAQKLLNGPVDLLHNLIDEQE